MQEEYFRKSFPIPLPDRLTVTYRKVRRVRYMLILIINKAGRGSVTSEDDDLGLFVLRKGFKMTREKSITLKKLLTLIMSFLIVAASMPAAVITGAQTAYAADSTISVSLSRSDSNYSYGGTGLAHKFSVTVGGKTRPAFCLEPDKVAPSTGTRKAAAMSDSSKVAQTMYYCYGYPGQKKLQNWLNNNGYSSYSSGTDFYLLSHVLLSYAYDSSGAFVGWTGGQPNTEINASYQEMVKKAYAYVKSLDDPAGFDSQISFSSGAGSTSKVTWTEDLEFKSETITLKGHEDNYVEYTVPSDMTLHMNGKTYSGGTEVTIEGGNSFYLTTQSIDRANTTYSSPVLTGNLLDYTAYKITDSGAQTMAFFATNKADTASFKVSFGAVSAEIGIKKVDAETGNVIPQAGVVFEISDESGNTICTVTTDASGTAKTPELEPGKYFVREIKAPTGYYLVSDKEAIEITPEDCAKGEISYTKADPPQKGIISIEKYGDYINNAGNRDEELLANIKFRIVAAEDIYSGDTVTKFYSRGDVVQDDLITDIKGRVSSDKLPLGKYRVEEVGAFDRETGEPIPDYKYHIIDGQNYRDITISPAEQTVKVIYCDMEQRNDGIPEIGTTARDSATGDSEGEHSKTATIIDTVRYEKLEPGKEYTVKGKLMDADTGMPLLIDGKEVTSQKTFVATQYDGAIDIAFTVDSTKLSGKTVVVFEELYRYKTKVAAHADITDRGQTITFPDVNTEAHSVATGSHMGERSEKAVIIDTVSYSNLIPGKTYTLTGTLMNKATGKPIEQNGQEVTVSFEFTPEAADGTAQMTFEVDSTALAGETVVVFEELYRNGVLVGCHADISDEGQSIYFPEISTTAMDSETKDNQGHTAKEVTIIDMVKYENLEPGREYRLTGVLMDKAKNAPLVNGDEVITSEMTFTPEKSSGEVQMSFTVDSTLLEGTTTVVFENLYTEDIELAVHADIDDEGQSVHWSFIKTSAKDSKTDSRKGTLSRFDKIVDTVTYTNLIPGKEYKVKGILMDKETGKPVKVKGEYVTAEKSFVPKEASGTVDIVFHFDSRELDEKTVVVFEDLYHNGVLITSHADIKDKAQSITYPEKPEPVISIPQTGDTTNLLAYAGIALASLAAALAMAVRTRRKNAEDNDDDIE